MNVFVDDKEMKKAQINWDKDLKKHTKKIENLSKKVSKKQRWDLFPYIARYVAPRLKAFREKQNGHPSNLTFEEWLVILEDMDYAMTVTSCASYPLCEHDEDRVIRGLKYFGEYFLALWD